MGEACVEARGPHHVVQELADLPDARIDAGVFAVILQQARVAFPNEDHAAGRRADNVVVAPEQGVHAFGQCGRIPFETGVGHRLPAAGLVEWVVHLAPHAPQQLAGGAPDLRIDGVDIAGNEQSDFHSCL